MRPICEWNISDEAIEAAFAELESVFGKRVTQAEVQREHHSHGESHHAPALPDIVCFPRTTEEVVAVMKVSARHQLPVIPFGAGTSVEGQVNAIGGGICLDLRDMKRVLRLSAADCDATVEAGITRLQLVDALKNTGLTFFVDPGADATIGGMVGTRASGTTAVKYGTMRENVLALTVVLADGKVIKTGSRARKSSAGYDLTHLFVGSEGTLGVITEVTLRLHPIPEAVSAAVCAFGSVEGAIQTAIESIQLGLGVARIEFLDEKQVEAVNRYSSVNLPLLPMLFVEFHGMNARSTADQAEVLEALAKEHGGQGFQWKSSLEEREELWHARHHAYYAAHALRPNARVLVTDVCVPISRLAECICETKKDLSGEPFPATILGHVGDGNFHVLCVLDGKSDSEFASASRFVDQVVHRALAMGGTCTGEHGIGFGKLKYMQEEHGEALGVMRAIKQTLDPENRMNPGKVIALPQGRTSR
jgi:D-lactate dehydrogenase (cytochrome)